MALINCPECSKEISEKSNVCIHCGFPLQDYIQEIEKDKIAKWDKRIDNTLKMNDEEKVQELIHIGEEGYARGYNRAGLYYNNIGDLENAYKYYCMALELDADDKNILNNLGLLYAQNTFSKFNTNLAIEYLKRSDNGSAHNNLAGIYEGLNKGFEEFIDYELAIKHYQIAIAKGYINAHVLNNIGVLFGRKEYYVVAASYCFLSSKMDCKEGKDNYEYYMKLVEEHNGPIWKKNIDSIKSVQDIDRMIERVNQEINKPAVTHTENIQQNRIKCPKCEKTVSSTAILCPHCGFAVKNFYDEKAKKKIEHQNFLESNKKLSLDGDSWYILFDVYSFMIDRITEVTKELPKFRIVRFDEEFHSPLDFTNELFTLLEDCYHDIVKHIRKEMSSFSNLDIRKNVTEYLSKYNYVYTMRTILARWSNLVNTPFDRQYSAVLEKADYNYSMDVIKESEMGYGIITNSFTTMALYSLHASIKESNAKYKAETNRQNYISSAVNNIQNNIVRVWESHFDELLNDIELLHQLIIYEIGQVVFDGYFFDWFMVDSEFSKPANKQMYNNKKKAIDSVEQRLKAEELTALQTKANIFIDYQSQRLDRTRVELSQCQYNLNNLGFALFGNKAEQRRKLKEDITKKESLIKQLEQIINSTKNKIPVRNLEYVRNLSPFFGSFYEKHRLHDVFKLCYEEKTLTYEVKNESGEKIDSLPVDFTIKYGAYRKFSAIFKNAITSYQNNIPHQTDIYLIISSND